MLCVRVCVSLSAQPRNPKVLPQRDWLASAMLGARMRRARSVMLSDAYVPAVLVPLVVAYLWCTSSVAAQPPDDGLCRYFSSPRRQSLLDTTRAPWLSCDFSESGLRCLQRTPPPPPAAGHVTTSGSDGEADDGRLLCTERLDDEPPRKKMRL